jgi:indoleamine 2,3-dioxygenase
MFIEEGEPDGCCFYGQDIVKGGPKRYPGGSAAQSSLIHALDIFLDVKHVPTGYGSSANTDTKTANKPTNFLTDMRYHMPGKFRDYLKQLEQAPSVRDYLTRGGSPTGINPERWERCASEYNACVHELKVFRDRHIQIVTRYIIMQAQRAKQTGQDSVVGQGYHGMGPSARDVIKFGNDPLVSNDGLGELPKAISPVGDAHEPGAGSRGTGGTDIMPFLKQSRDETQDTEIKPLH